MDSFYLLSAIVLTQPPYMPHKLLLSREESRAYLQPLLAELTLRPPEPERLCNMPARRRFEADRGIEP